MASRDDEFTAREQGCYGPNCKMGQPVCMNLTTGGLMSVLLIVKYLPIHILKHTKRSVCACFEF